MTIESQTYQARREYLIQSLPENTVAVLRTGDLCMRNNDCAYEFRPNSSLFYLTGFPEPSAYVLINANGDTVLITLPKDPEREQWEGCCYGVEGVMSHFGVYDAVPLSELDDTALILLDGAKNVAFPFADQGLCKQVLSWRDSLEARAGAGALVPTQLVDLSPVLSEMRLHKDKEEIVLMEKAAQISVAAHKQAMRTVRPGMKEDALEAELNYVFMKSGARQPAYNNIVASGSNACILHYTKNNEVITDGDLVLIDSGAEFGCYAGDLTCTFPANGKFSKPQAALYQVVLNAHTAGLKELKVGVPYEACHNVAVKVLTEGLVSLGLLSGDVDSLIERKAYRDFYMHNTGHWLGLDVHDCGAYKVNGESRLLAAGMTLTIEPGLYVSADNESVEEKWRGIGIRIEDDVLIRADGPYVLTHGMPREIDDIETFMAQNR